MARRDSPFSLVLSRVNTSLNELDQAAELQERLIPMNRA